VSIDLKMQYDKIYRYCYMRVHNRETAEDLTQETFLRFLEHPQYHDKNLTLQYLYTIAGNLCIDEFRKKPTEPLPDNLLSPNDCENDVLTHVGLQQAFLSLSEEEREIIMLRYVNEVPVSVISKLYNISRFALNRRIKKSLATLRSAFEMEESANEQKI